jgi:branched-chain amino acid transport system substrate-binding protein
MYITYAGLPYDRLQAGSSVARAFATDFANMYGHSPSSTYVFYGAAVAQLVLKAIAASDGTRAGVRNELFSGLKVPAAVSVIGVDTGINPITGDTIAKQLCLFVMRRGGERFVREVDLP